MVSVLVTCTRCGKREAFFFRRTSGEALCRQCFVKSLEMKVLRTIRRFRLIEPQDRIGLAVSGGKDSLVLLCILGKLFRRRHLKCSETYAFTIDEELEYSKFKLTRINVIRELSREAGFEYRVYRISELIGVSVPEVYSRLSERGEKIHMCTVCGVLRRKAVNILARRLNLTKIVTAHNLDDEAQTAILNVLVNDVKRFKWFGVVTGEDVEDLVPRVKPLRYIREEEIAVYAYVNNIPMLERECPYVRENPRYMLKFLLSEIEQRNPNVKYMIVSFGDELSRIIRTSRYFKEKIRLRRCRICGAPSTSDVCRACDLVSRAGLLERYIDAMRV